jgi:hypothetical protein
MGTSGAAATLGTRCPLCGSPILSVGAHGIVRMEEARTMPLFNSRGMGQGYLLCEECFALAGLPQSMMVH